MIYVVYEPINFGELLQNLRDEESSDNSSDEEVRPRGLKHYTRDEQNPAIKT